MNLGQPILKSRGSSREEMFFKSSYSQRSICVTFTPDSLLRQFPDKYYHVAFTVLVSAFLTQNRHKFEVFFPVKIHNLGIRRNSFPKATVN